MSWIENLINARSNHVKKAIFEVLQEKYLKNELIIERLLSSLGTEKDCKDFLQLIADSYEAGYLKSVRDHRSELQKVGLIAKIRPEDKE